jgi:hypothetical protein
MRRNQRRDVPPGQRSWSGFKRATSTNGCLSKRFAAHLHALMVNRTVERICHFLQSCLPFCEPFLPPHFGSCLTGLRNAFPG